jgi:hypothetical protein
MDYEYAQKKIFFFQKGHVERRRNVDDRLGSEHVARAPYDELQLSDRTDGGTKDGVQVVYVKFGERVALQILQGKFKKKFQETAFNFSQNEKPRNVF